MIVSVKVTASAGEAYLEEAHQGQFNIWVRETPVDGKANTAVCRAIAKHFGIAPSRVSVKKGHTSRHKIIEII